MGPRLTTIVAAVLLVTSLIAQDAFADRTRTPSRGQIPVKTKAMTTPSVLPALTGTYTLTRINARLVRDRDLARSSVTFTASGAASAATACNFLTTTLQSRPAQSVILGFGQIASTLKACSPGENEAEAITLRLFRDTANIARAGTSLTFFNATGNVIAQWTAQAALQPISERSAPPPGAPLPERISFGDYVLTEIGGNPVVTPFARDVSVRPTRQASSEAAPPSLPLRQPPNSSLPTLFLRANGQVIGGTGCNQYNSRIVPAANGSSRFGPIVSSKKACLNRAMGRREDAFFAVMRRATRIDITSSHIDLYHQNRTRLARLSAIQPEGLTGPTLYGTTWTLRSINNVPVRLTDPPTILFANSQATGTTGCGNRFTIQHERRSGTSRFSDSFVTKMACRNRAHNDLQTRYMAALITVSQVDITSTTLTLRSSDGQTILAFDAD